MPQNSGPTQSDGLPINRVFTTDEHHYDALEWQRRDAVLRRADGSVVFEQNDVEAPAGWSDTALTVVAQKYFRGAPGDNDRETSVKDMIDRVIDTIYEWGLTDGYFAGESDAESFRDELKYLIARQMMAFNSPVWFNVGWREKPQASACFINSVNDSMDSILGLAKTEGMLFKQGSGTGTNLSTLRGSMEGLAGGGIASGPVSFMRGFDSFAGAIKSGGSTRRAAKMVILDADHPDIISFIRCKVDEEKKAHALIDAGYNGKFNVPGGAYDSVSYQNANHSVRVTDEFMRAVEDDAQWGLVARAGGSTLERVSARDLFKEMAESAWFCGDPGIQFQTTINNWHTVPNSGPINASNPCGEYLHLDDTACNLASLNLLKFLNDNGTFCIGEFVHACRLTILAQEILVGRASYPTEMIAKNSHDFRPLGLGYANLGSLLMSSGIPYDSSQGRALASALTALMTGSAYKMSAEIAAVKGAFAGFSANQGSVLGIIDKHHQAAQQIPPLPMSFENIFDAARISWAGAQSWANAYGVRNSQVSVLAPCGTIGRMMDCDTTGPEPAIALVSYKLLVGGGTLKLVNGCVPQALRSLEYSERDIERIVSWTKEHGTVEGIPVAGVRDEHLSVFDCALGERSIEPMGHVRMVAAVQPFLSGGVSKTVNLPSRYSADDIADIYLQAWKLGVKSITVYRDECKRSQPLSTKSEAKAASKKAGPPEATRRRLPAERDSKTHRFSVGGHEGYITVGLYENGEPGEIFIHMAKQGSAISGLVDSFAVAISTALQHGVPLKSLCEKYRGTRFEPSGFTGNQEIPIATSVMDYVFRWLDLRFGEVEEQHDEVAAPPVVEDSDAPPCHECGSLMIRSGSCHRCLNCGSTSGCS